MGNTQVLRVERSCFLEILRSKLDPKITIIDPSEALIKKFNNSFLIPKNASSDYISYDNVRFFVTEKNKEFSLKVNNWLGINKEISLVNLRSNA